MGAAVFLRPMPAAMLTNEGPVKTCSKCGEAKDEADFSRWRAQCKTCVRVRNRAWHAANPEKNREYKTAWRAANPGKHSEQERVRRAAAPEKARARERERRAENPERFRKQANARYAADPEKFREQQKAYRAADPGKSRARYAANPKKFQEQQRARYAANPGKHLAQASLRRAMKTQQTPPWSETAAITEFYDNRPEGMHVDHVIPLKGQRYGVSGLHVLANLQYLSGPANQSKSNRFSPDDHAWRA